MNDLGSSWYINSDVDNVEVYKITEDMITAKILKKYDSDLSLCNLGRENLKDMFYDKDGWGYFKAEKHYRFNLQIKEFVKNKNLA